MSLSAVTTTTKSYDTSNMKKASKVSDNKSNSSKAGETEAAVYEKSSNEKKPSVYTKDTVTINKLKADAEKRTSQLRDLVEKLMLKQGQTFDEANMYQLLREGKVPVDSETAKQAQEDISENGYYGVAQTSDRLVSFAMALSGGDPDKADLMIESVKKGFEQATEAWGGELPGICKDTLDATIKKLEDWKNSITQGESSTK
jgi:hypothetical protein